MSASLAPPYSLSSLDATTALSLVQTGLAAAVAAAAAEAAAPPSSPSLSCSSTTNTTSSSSSSNMLTGSNAPSEPDLSDPLLYRIPQFPLTPLSKSRLSLSPAEAQGTAAYVVINGCRLPAIAVAGEPRIPLSLLYRRALRAHSECDIGNLMDDLSIHQHIATPNQVNVLRQLDSELLSDDSKLNVSLVSRTDVERLLGLLRLESQVRIRIDAVKVDQNERLPVSHRMFGNVQGWLYPCRKGGRSIQCRQCEYWFIPEDFVMHSHWNNKENQRVVHWGFDAANWRLMMQLEEPERGMPDSMLKWNMFISEDDHQEMPCQIKRSATMNGDQLSDTPRKLFNGGISPLSSGGAGSGYDDLNRQQPRKIKGDFVISLMPAAGSKVDPALQDILNKEMNYKRKVMSDAHNGRLPGIDPSTPSTSADLQKLLSMTHMDFPPASEWHPSLELAPPKNGTQDMMRNVAELENILANSGDAMDERAKQILEQMKTSLAHTNQGLDNVATQYQRMHELYSAASYIVRLYFNPDTPMPHLDKLRAEQAALCVPMPPLPSTNGKMCSSATGSLPSLAPPPLPSPMALTGNVEQQLLAQQQVMAKLAQINQFNANIGGMHALLTPQQQLNMAQFLTTYRLPPPQNPPPS